MKTDLLSKLKNKFIKVLNTNNQELIRETFFSIVDKLNKNEIDSFDINILMYDYLEKNCFDKVLKDTVDAIVELHVFMLFNEIDDFLNKQSSMGEIDITFKTGFYFIMTQYSDSPISLNFFAKRMLKKIFISMNLEEYLHNNYISYDAFISKNKSEKSFIINYISTLDSTLSAYLIKNSSALDEIILELEAIKNNWHNYTSSDQEKVINNSNNNDIIIKRG